MMDHGAGRSPLRPDDLRRAADCACATLGPATSLDWSRNARDLDWTCLATARHVVFALISYAGHLATRSLTRRVPPSDRVASVTYDPATQIEQIGTAAAILAAVCAAAPPDARAFHPSGIVDPEGFLAMGCSEILVHTFDIASALGLPFDPPGDLAARVAARLFPWAPTDGDPWQALLWANGRIALPNRPRQGPDWGWHPTPLDEWNGEIIYDN